MQRQKKKKIKNKRKQWMSWAELWDLFMFFIIIISFLVKIFFFCSCIKIKVSRVCILHALFFGFSLHFESFFFFFLQTILKEDITKIHSVLDSIHFAFSLQGHAVKKKRKENAHFTHTRWNSLRSSVPLCRLRTKALRVFRHASCTTAARVSFSVSIHSRKCSFVTLHNSRLLYCYIIPTNINKSHHFSLSICFSFNYFFFLSVSWAENSPPPKKKSKQL